MVRCYVIMWAGLATPHPLPPKRQQFRPDMGVFGADSEERLVVTMAMK